MRRYLSLTMAAVVSLSLSACGTTRIGMNDRNRGTNITRISQPNDAFTGRYRDGIYTAYGDGHANGNESATIDIRNGRIVDIDFGNVALQRGYNNNFAPGTGYGTANRIGITGTAIGSRTGMDTGTGTGMGTGVGAGGNNQGGRINVTGSGYGLTPGTITNTNPGSVVRKRVGTRINAGTGTGMTQGGNTTARTSWGKNSGDVLNRIKSDLETSMINHQTYAVEIDNTDRNLASTINNWKLAARRALEQASR